MCVGNSPERSINGLDRTKNLKKKRFGKTLNAPPVSVQHRVAAHIHTHSIFLSVWCSFAFALVLCSQSLGVGDNNNWPGSSFSFLIMNLFIFFRRVQCVYTRKYRCPSHCKHKVAFGGQHARGNDGHRQHHHSALGYLPEGGLRFPGGCSWRRSSLH